MNSETHTPGSAFALAQATFRTLAAHVSRMRALTAIAVALMCNGCSLTTFESPPLGDAMACDPRLVGTWAAGAAEMSKHDYAIEYGESPEEDDGESAFELDTYYRISADCVMRSTETGNVPEDIELLTFSFIPGKTDSYAYAPLRKYLEDEDAEEAADMEGDTRTPAAKLADKRFYERLNRSYAILRYQVQGETVRIWGPISRPTSGLINAGRIRGLTRLVDDEEIGDTFINLVTGDRAEISRVLARHPDIFTRDPILVMRRHDGPIPQRDEEEEEDSESGPDRDKEVI